MCFDSSISAFKHQDIVTLGSLSLGFGQEGGLKLEIVILLE